MPSHQPTLSRIVIQLIWQQDVLQCRQRRYQLIRLKHKPDRLASHLRQLVLGQIADRRAVQMDVPGTRSIQPRQQTQQRRLAAPARPHHRGKLPLRHGKIQPLQNVHGSAAITNGLTKSFNRNHRSRLAQLGRSPSHLLLDTLSTALWFSSRRPCRSVSMAWFPYGFGTV